MGKTGNISEGDAFRRALNYRESHLRSVLLAIPDMIFILDTEGCFLEYKPGIGQEAYTSPEEFLGRHYAEILPLPVSGLVKEAFGTIARGELPEAFEYDIMMDGCLKRYECSVVPIDEGMVMATVKDITRRTTAELSLKQSEAKYRALFEATADAILLMEGDAFHDCNQACLELFGFSTKEELSAVSFEGLCPELQPGGVPSGILGRAHEAKALAGGRHRFQWCFLKRGGQSSFLADIQLTRVDLPGRQLLQSVIRDISEQRRLEDALRCSEENFRNFFETLGDMAFIADRNGRILYTNSAVPRALGYTADALMAMAVLDLHPESVREEASTIFKEMVEGVRNHCPLPLATQEGALIPVETRIWFGVWDGQTCIFGISKDLSKEQEALQKFNKMFDNNPALMALTDIDGRFVEVNDAFIRKTGYSRQELMGRTAAELSLIPEFNKHRRADQELMAKGQMVNKLLKVRTKRGHLLEGLFSGDLIESQGNTYKLTVMVDLTGYLRAQKMLRESVAKARELARQAKEASASKSIFLATMSHEIRTPMNGLLGFLNLLEHTALDEEQTEYIREIKGSSDVLLSVIDDILDMSKIEAGKLEMEQIAFDLAEVLEQSVFGFAAKADQTGIELRLDMDPVLPRFVVGDPIRLRQVVGNLVGNAIKFTQTGSVTVRSAALPEGMMRISVKDTGIGIPAAALKRLFTPFEQADGSSTRRYGGTGLGLAICKSIVELIGGEIWVESKENVGSEFSFTVPLRETGMSTAGAHAYRRIPATAENASESVEVVRGAAGDLDSKRRPLSCGRPRILLTEDNQTNQKVFAKMLEKMGLQCDIADNGEIAVQRVMEESYDLVFMDCQMPVLDGYEATRRIRKLEEGGRQTPIVAVTACAMAGDRERCLDAGMDDCLHKPVGFRELRQMLERYQESSQVESYLERILHRFRVNTAMERSEALDILVQCLPEAVELLRKARQEIAAADYQKAGRLLHQLKGVAGNLQIEESAELLRHCEMLCREAQGDRADTALAEVAILMERIHQGLRETSNARRQDLFKPDDLP